MCVSQTSYILRRLQLTFIHVPFAQCTHGSNNSFSYKRLVFPTITAYFFHFPLRNTFFAKPFNCPCTFAFTLWIHRSTMGFCNVSEKNADTEDPRLWKCIYGTLGNMLYLIRTWEIWLPLRRLFPDPKIELSSMCWTIMGWKYVGNLGRKEFCLYCRFGKLHSKTVFSNFHRVIDSFSLM